MSAFPEGKGSFLLRREASPTAREASFPPCPPSREAREASFYGGKLPRRLGNLPIGHVRLLGRRGENLILSKHPLRARHRIIVPVLIESTSVRPNGSGDLSPGLRPKADALGRQGPPSLRPEGSREPTRQEGSRGPSGRNGLSSLPPRASAFGLSPGLRSPGPLGRTEPDLLGLPCSGELVQLFCDES